MARTPSQTGGVVQTWPLPIATQALAIANAVSAYSVPIQVFMGMYNNETTLGTLRNADGSIQTSPPPANAIGPFQMEPDTAHTYGYPLTSTPNSSDFIKQANGAAHYLHDIYVDFVPSAKSWVNALAGYNGGPGNFAGSQEQNYGQRAMAFQIPAAWKADLAGNFSGAGTGPASPGGTAGAGGTGTLLNDSSGFQVGDPSNPDEDFWTALNRLAQERYWYLFSDGETLYLADGPDLMKQTPAMTLDRVADSGIINHLEFTFDNTAWQYAATHKKRKRTQRRTALAKITSPVEGLCDVVCKIDEVRAGDVATFVNTGPGDGQWLVGDVRRSVFQVTSEITVVPALTPLTEGELNPAQQNPTNLSAFASTVTIGGYTNPVGNWSPSRIDQGVDGTLKSPYLAPGDSKIIQSDVSNPGWQGGGWLTGQLTSGSLKGKVWYVAEGIAPLVPAGAVVKAGTAVARTIPSPYNTIVGNIETGWADPGNPGRPLAQSLPGYGGDQSPQAMAAGNSFNRFLLKLGASPGAAQGTGVGVVPASMPPGYP